MATEDERYRQSTQYKLWSFTPPHLASLRAECNGLARKAISARLQATAPDEALPEFLTPEEEASLVVFYTSELLRAAAFMELPTEIRATSAVFLRRFYVTNSIMTYPPTELLKTCLFFGSKAEGTFQRLADFADKFPNTTPEQVLAAEYILSQGIRFALDVKHPFRALEGAVMQLRTLADLDQARIDRAHGRAREVLKFSPLVTDAYFHYTPSQIMLASLAMADEELAERLVQGATAADAGLRGKIWDLIGACRAMLEKEPPSKMDEGAYTKPNRPLIKKLKKCRDPDRVDLVALQRARREAGLQKKPKTAPLSQDGAVFGASFGAALPDERETKRRKMEGLE